MKLDNHLIEEWDDEDKALWEELGNLSTPTPSAESRIRFHAMLDTFQEDAQKENLWDKLVGQWNRVFTPKTSKWAYALLLLIAGAGLGYFSGKYSPNKNEEAMVASEDKVEKLSTEVQEMREVMMLSMLENPMATERLKAVSYTQELNTVDNRVIDALLTTLNFDQNENVRLVTLEALIQLGHNPKVREGLVQSLLHQESPLMQVALADAMVKLQEKRSVKQFKQLLKKNNLNNAVKGKIEKTIQVLS
jgi:hypothetical protein